MNGADPFEAQLRRQAPRHIPPVWRAEILNAADQAAPRDTGSATVPRAWLSTLNSQLSTLLWPHPRAWAGLAAIWLVILTFDFAAREPSGRQVMRQADPPSPQMRALLQQQEQMMAELVGPIERPEARHSTPFTPQPHSQRREEFMNA